MKTWSYYIVEMDEDDECPYVVMAHDDTVGYKETFAYAKFKFPENAEEFIKRFDKKKNT